MKGLLWSAAVFGGALLMASPQARAGMTKSECQVMSLGISQLAPAVEGMLGHTERLDLGPLRGKAEGNDLSALNRFEQAREKLAPALREFAHAAQDMHYRFQVCSR